jgi:peptide/nickel transport system substrate-binding protein
MHISGFPLDSLRRRGGAIARMAVGAALIGSLALGAPHSATARTRLAPSFIDSGTLTVAMDTAAADIDPASDEISASDNIAHNIADQLVAYAHGNINRLVPALATSWSTNADKSVWTFHVRHGVIFHTGRCCLTAEDVQYSIGRTVAAKLAASYLYGRFLSKPFKQIKIVDPYTVEFDLGTPQPLLLAALASEYTGLILDAQALKAHVVKSDWGHAWAQDHDLGTGPYTIKSWEHGQQVVLTRFVPYWGGWSGPHFSKIVVLTVPESATRRELVERGQADFTFNLTPQDYDALKSNPQLRLSVDYGTQVEDFAMTEWGPLASPAARQAIDYAFNYRALVNGVMHGYGRRAYGPMARVLLGYDPHIFGYQTDLAKARALLAQAGVKPGTTLTLDYLPFTSYTRDAALILQAQLAQLGLTLKVREVSSDAFNGIFFGTEPPSQRPNFINLDWYPDYNDPYDMCSPTLASSSAGAAGANPGYYHNQQVDALLADMKYASGERLIADAHKMQDIVTRVDPAALWLDEAAQVVVMRKALQGYIFNPIELSMFTFYPMHR